MPQEHYQYTDLSEQTADGFVRRWADKYRPTGKVILEHILQSSAVHVDETKLNIVGHQQYVWVLTDGRWTVFRLTEGCEAAFLKFMLAGYKALSYRTFMAVIRGDELGLKIREWAYAQFSFLLRLVFWSQISETKNRSLDSRDPARGE